MIDTGSSLMPVEVKYQKLSKPKTTRSLRSFIGRYKPKKSLVVNLILDKIVMINSCEVCFIPFYKMMKKQLLEV